MPDWYRNTDWNEEIEQDFFTRLSRARSQRDQYIVLQALTLAESHPKVALRLVDFYFETRTDSFDDGRARMAATRARFADGGYEKALDEFQSALEGQSEGVNLMVASPLEFAFLAARYRSTRHYLAALDQLAILPPPERKIAELVFRFYAARALLLHETGRDPATAKNDADVILDLPEGLTAHFPDMLWRIRGIARR